MSYKTIKSDSLSENTIKKSRFICHLKRIETENDGRQFITKIKKEHYKATHSCSAMIVGEYSEIKRSSDDGEPSGTAGLPILSVLEKQELTNIVAVVTRYFGGIKLGANGLIRAYSGSVSQGLSEAELVEVKKQQGLKITLTYSQYQMFGHFLQSEHLKEHETEFLDIITTSIYIDPEHIDRVSQHLIEFYHGNVTFTKSHTKLIELPLS